MGYLRLVYIGGRCMNNDNVIISVPEEELIVSLYNNYLICHSCFNRSQEDTKMSVKAFSDYILEYLKDRYNLEDYDPEEDLT